MSSTDGSGTPLSTKSFDTDPSLVAPAFTAVQLQPQSAVAEVFTTGAVVLSFTPSANVPASAVLTLAAPDYLANSPLVYLPATVGCQPLANVGPIACSIDLPSKTLRVTGIAPAAGLPAGTQASLLITGMLLPVSMTPASGFRVSLLTADGYRFNREDSASLPAKAPKTITLVTASLQNNTVGVKGKLFLTLTLPPPARQSSVLKVSFTNFDTAGCSVVSSLGPFSSDCTTLVFTAQLAAATQVTLIFDGLANNNRTTDGSLLVALRDPVLALAAQAAPIPLSFVQQTIAPIISMLPSTLGASSELSVNFYTKVGYAADSILRVAFPPGLQLPPAPLCTINTLPAICTLSASSIDVKVATPISKDALITLKISSVNLALCETTLPFTITGVQVESGTGSTKVSQPSPLQLLLSANSSEAWVSAKLNVDITTTVVVPQPSLIDIILPTSAIVSSSTKCTVSGLGTAAICTIASNTNSFAISGLSAALSIGSIFTITIEDLISPRTVGTHKLSVSVSNGCKFMAGTTDWLVDTAAEWRSVTLVASQTTTASYYRLAYTVEPPQTPFASDKLQITPSFATDSPASTLAPVAFAASGQSGYFFAPAGGSVAYTVALLDAAGRPLLTATRSLAFSGSAAVRATAAFDATKRGLPATATLSLALDSYLPAGAKLTALFSDSFVLRGRRLAQTLALPLVTDYLPNSSISLTAAVTLPKASSIDPKDLTLQVLSPSGIVIASTSPLTEILPLTCEDSCTSCLSIATSCLACKPGFSLGGDSQCVDSSLLSKVKTGYPPLFLFIAAGLLTTAAALVMRAAGHASKPMNLAFAAHRGLLVAWTVANAVIYLVYFAPLHAGVFFGIAGLSLGQSLAMACLDPPRRCLEYISWVAGVGFLRIGIPGFRKQQAYGWRGPQPRETYSESKAEVEGFDNWSTKNAVLTSISEITVQIPFVIFGAVIFANYPKAYFALETSLVNALDIFLCIAAIIELRDTEIVTKSIFAKRNKGDTYRASDDQSDDFATPREKGRKLADGDASNANLLADDDGQTKRLRPPQSPSDPLDPDKATARPKWRYGRGDSDGDIHQDGYSPLALDSRAADARLLRKALLAALLRPQSPLALAAHTRPRPKSVPADLGTRLLHPNLVAHKRPMSGSPDRKPRRRSSTKKIEKLIDDYVREFVGSSSIKGLINSPFTIGPRLPGSKKPIKNTESNKEKAIPIPIFDPQTGQYNPEYLKTLQTIKKVPEPVIKPKPTEEQIASHARTLVAFDPMEKARQTLGKDSLPMDEPVTRWPKMDPRIGALGFLRDKVDPKLPLKDTPLNSRPADDQPGRPLSLHYADPRTVALLPFAQAGLRLDDAALVFRSALAVVDGGSLRRGRRFAVNAWLAQSADVYHGEATLTEQPHDDGRGKLEQLPGAGLGLLRLVGLQRARGLKPEAGLPPAVKDQALRELAALLRAGVVSVKEVAKRSEELGIGGVGAIQQLVTDQDTIAVDDSLKPTAINGQTLENLVARKIKLADGRWLPLEKQDPRLLEHGIYIDDKGQHLFLGDQSIGDLRKGIIKDPKGNRVLLANIAASDLLQGIWRDSETGEVATVNGQNLVDLSTLIVVDKEGRKMNLRRQDHDEMLKGKMVTDGGVILDLGSQQHKALLERGLYLSKDGVVRHLADIGFADLALGKQLALPGRRLSTGKFHLPGPLSPLDPAEEGARLHKLRMTKFKAFFGDDEFTVACRQVFLSKLGPVGDDLRKELGQSSKPPKRLKPKPRENGTDWADTSNRLESNWSLRLTDGGPDHFQFNNQADRDLLNRFDKRKPGQREQYPESLTVNLLMEKDESVDLTLNVEESEDNFAADAQINENNKPGSKAESKFYKIPQSSLDDLNSEFMMTGDGRQFSAMDSTQNIYKKFDVAKARLEEIARRHQKKDSRNDASNTLIGYEDNRALKTSTAGRRV